MKFDIVKMDIGHIDSVMKVEFSSFALPWSEAMFVSELRSPLTYYIVALGDGELLGYGGMYKVLDEGHITNIAVHPYYRRNGVASGILSHIIDSAMKSELYFLTLEVRQSNLLAINLYEKYGFKSVGIRKGYYHDNNEDAILMTKYLTKMEAEWQT